MIVTESKAFLISRISELKESGNLIGFVPTMGALHDGHISLVKQSVLDNNVCIVSIFINPRQFNKPSDLEKYPRTIKEDLEFLDLILRPDDIVFTPGVDEIYNNHQTVKYDFGGLEDVLEGKYREGHFQGVATVVNILFDIVKPDRAYFGLKDYQQYLIIKKLINIAKLNIEIKPCEIVREKNGLAMSSRNKRLSKDIRSKAGIIYQALKKVQTIAAYSEINELKILVSNIIDSVPGFELEYFEIVNSETLMPVDNLVSDEGVIACIAVYAEDIRLIDNIIIK